MTAIARNTFQATWTYLYLQDPFLFKKIQEFDFSDQLGMFPKCRSEYVKRNTKEILDIIRDKIDYNAFYDKDADGSFMILGMDDEIYFPKSDRFFVKFPSQKVFDKIYPILLKNFAGKVSLCEDCQLIQVLI